MRRFRFRLETVLNHRETIETLREQDFASAQGQLQAIEARIAALRMSQVLPHRCKWTLAGGDHYGSSCNPASS